MTVWHIHWSHGRLPSETLRSAWLHPTSLRKLALEKGENQGIMAKMTLSQVRLVKSVWFFLLLPHLGFFAALRHLYKEILTQHERVHLGTSDQTVVQKWFAALSATWKSLDGWRLVQCLNSGDWKSISCRSRHVSCSSLGWLKDEADDI